MHQIYTIHINEHFDRSREDASCGCPVCSLYRMLEENELELILGASMMEPDIRQKTNKLGFCDTHMKMMFEYRARLPMALTLESHLDQLRKEVGDLPLMVPGTRARARIAELEEDCYVCRRIDEYFGHLLENLVYIWSSDPEFREKFAAQPLFCLPHWEIMLGVAKAKLNKKDYYAFAKAANDVVLPYFDQLREDVSWFCKKFDYRYGDEPWYNSKDSVERAMAFLNSDIHRPPKKK
ncbi:MAG: hypothetical protein J6S14_02725 [Clostridia bacterium]|nr:hypothetical protein [Clostridia bacterium]